jgi:hypothetical protein
MENSRSFRAAFGEENQSTDYKRVKTVANYETKQLTRMKVKH